tara:strand:- start:387 stop:758 length:372 start_codon:yes stop_codon:yes gene_type:complete
VIVDLPFPHKILWPNGPQANRGWRAAEVKKHRQWAHDATRAERSTTAPIRPVIALTVYPKPRGPAPDKDNTIAACKAYFDGIADALKVNDRRFDAPHVTISEQRVQGGRITFHITDTREMGMD